MVQIAISNDIIPPFGKWCRFIFIEFSRYHLFSEKIVREDGFYWLYKKDKKIDGPFCPGCYEDHTKRIHLQPPSDGFYICNINRQHKYKDPNYEPAEFEL